MYKNMRAKRFLIIPKMESNMIQPICMQLFTWNGEKVENEIRFNSCFSVELTSKFVNLIDALFRCNCNFFLLIEFCRRSVFIWFH